MKKFLCLTFLVSLCLGGVFLAQQPQTSDVSNVPPLFRANASYVQGVGPGYWPTAGSGLILNLSAATVSIAGTIYNYAGGSLTLPASSTVYVYLLGSGTPVYATSGYPTGAVPLATVVTGASAITSITDTRSFLSTNFFVPTPGQDVNLYVSPSGNDTTGLGTFASPYATVGRALKDIPTFVSNHYVINLAAGTYREEVDIAGRYFGPNAVTNFNKATVEIKGDPLAPDSYVISGADSGAPTTPVRNYAVACEAANCILNGVSVQYAKVGGYSQRRGYGVINASTLRHFTFNNQSTALLANAGFVELRGACTINDAYWGVVGEANSVIFNASTYDPLNSSFSFASPLTISGVTGGGGIVIEERSYGFVSGTTNITGTGAVGSVGLYVVDESGFDSETVNVTSFPTGVWSQVFSRTEINTPTITTATTGIQVQEGSRFDALVAEPAFTGVTTNYSVSQGSSVATPTKTIFPSNIKVVTFSATPTFDAYLGNVQEITLTGSVTSFTLTNSTAGQTLKFIWIQDATGGRTVSGAPTNMKGFTAPGITANKYSIQSCTYDGTNWVCETAATNL